MEYARALIKKAHASDVETDDEDTRPSVKKDRSAHHSSSSPSGYSSAGSVHGGTPSEDWSVISDQDDHERRSSIGSQVTDGKNKQDKRRSFTAAVLSVLPDSLNPGSPQRTTSPLPLA